MSQSRFSYFACVGFALGFASMTALAWACASHTLSDSKAKRSKLDVSFYKQPTAMTSRAPASAGHVPWGGNNPQTRNPEARLAELFQELQVKYGDDVVLSVPVRFQMSSFHPYGDGQSNASVDFGPHWSYALPPFYAVEFKDSLGRVNHEFVFHPRLGVHNRQLHRIGKSIYLVKPEGWIDSFMVSFETGQIPVDEFLDGIRLGLRKFTQERSAPDPEQIGQGGAAGTAFEKLLKHTWSSGYNSDPYVVDNIHGFFPSTEGRRTAVGGGWTWVVEAGMKAPFKHLYTCFAGRDLAEESRYGAATGAGWHHVGDPAETILNTIESASIPAALGRFYGNTGVNLAPAYGLNGSATFRNLQPKEVFVTRKNEFHWYAIPTYEPLCTEIWVHHCEPTPSNSWGMDCSN